LPTIRGLGTVLRQVPEYADTVNEIGLKNTHLIYQDPLVRLIFIATKVAMTLHNSQSAAHRTLAAPLNNSFQEKYSAL